MKTIAVPSIKAVIPFKAGSLPKIDPLDPRFELVLGGLKIVGKINAKTARKLQTHPGGAALQGRLIVEQGWLVLAEAGCQFFDPKPAEASLPATELTRPPVGALPQ